MTGNKRCRAWEHHVSRRQWLGAAGAGMWGAAQLPLLAEQIQRENKQVLFLWIDGGMSQLESWDPKPGTRFGGPFRAIPTSVPGVHISELMPRTAQQMHRLAVVRSLCTKDNSHSAGVARIQRGDPKDRGVTYPYFGSAVAKLLGPGESGLPPYVWIKPGSGGFIYQDAGFLGPKYGAVAFGDGQPPPNMAAPQSLAARDLDERAELQALANRRYQNNRRASVGEAQSYVFDTARNLAARRELFDTNQFSEQELDRYGRNDFGLHTLLGRKMIEAGVRFVKVNSYGWDTHGDNFNGHLSLMPKFDQAFASVVEDLDERGLLDQVLVIAMSEFGRTPRINGHIGRDHWPEAWSLAMAGCGVQRGVVLGETNEEGTWVKSDECDIGHIFHTWFQALGVDPAATEYLNNGQPLPIAHDDCHALTKVLA